MYCNTASYGLPPRPAWDALQSALTDGGRLRTSWHVYNTERDVDAVLEALTA